MSLSNLSQSEWGIVFYRWSEDVSTSLVRIIEEDFFFN